MEHVLSPYVAYWIGLAAGILGFAGMMFGEAKRPWLAFGAAIGWIAIFLSTDLEKAEQAFELQLATTAGLVFLLVLVMTIIEGGVHYGMLNAILRLIQTERKRVLMFIVGLMTFFLSAILDNITSSIISAVLVVQLMRVVKDRITFACLIVSAACAGGIWSGVGNPTSTLLWVGGQLSFDHMFRSLFLPSLVYLSVIFAFFWPRLGGRVERPVPDELDKKTLEQTVSFELSLKEQWGILVLVVSCIGIIVGLKLAYHIPPALGAVAAFAVWGLFTWRVNKAKGAHFLAERNVQSALRHVDHATLVVFILLLPLVGALGQLGILDDLAKDVIKGVDTVLTGGEEIWGVTAVMGLISSIVPNTPLVAASQIMFNYPQDHLFWVLLNYTTGVGGTLLPFGTAAGVVLTSKFKDQLTAGEYVRILFVPSLNGYVAGLLTIYIQNLF